MIRSDIRINIRDNLRESTAAVWTDAELNRYIDLGQKQIATRLHPNYLFTLIQEVSDTTLVSTPNYNLPSDFLLIIGQPNIETANYTLIPMHDVDTIRNATGGHILFSKKICWIQNNDLYFYPFPSSGLAILYRYLKYPVDLAADGTASDLPENLMQLLIWYCSSLAYSKLGDAETQGLTAYYLRLYEAEISALNAMAGMGTHLYQQLWRKS